MIDPQSKLPESKSKIRHTIAVLKSAKSDLVSVKPDSPLKEATTKMLLNDFSQLPVIASDDSLVGVISWKTIGVSEKFGSKKALVKDCMDRNVKTVKLSDRLLKSVRDVIENDFVFVEDETKKVTGIVTLFDIARQFQKLIEPFIELQQIELSLRNLIEAKIDNEKFLAFCTKTLPYRKAKSSDDLTFGDYLKVVNNAEFWELFNLDLDRKAFVEKLDTVRAIRNEVMHFKTKGVSRRDLKHLKDVSKFFRVLERFTLGSSKSDDADY